MGAVCLESCYVTGEGPVASPRRRRTNICVETAPARTSGLIVRLPPPKWRVPRRVLRAVAAGPVPRSILPCEPLSPASLGPASDPSVARSLCLRRIWRCLPQGRPPSRRSPGSLLERARMVSPGRENFAPMQTPDPWSSSNIDAEPGSLLHGTMRTQGASSSRSCSTPTRCCRTTICAPPSSRWSYG